MQSIKKFIYYIFFINLLLEKITLPIISWFAEQFILIKNNLVNRINE